MRRVKSRLLCLFVLSALPSIGVTDVVKQSGAGICHSTDSPYYDRVKNFRGFETLQDCLRSGGRLPRDRGYTRQQFNSQVYGRERFGHGWADEDGDCQNTRMEVLIDQSTVPVRFARGEDCRVVYGRWISPFTGQVIQDGSQVQIDHVVPLKWAWERGALTWTQAKREQFANDRINLIPVERSLNASKGAQGPDQWLPPSAQCGYIARFVRVVKIYGLRPPNNESAAISKLLGQCKSGDMLQAG